MNGDAFTKIHGTPIQAGANHWLFPDGASVTHNGFDPVLRPPPVDPVDCWLARHRYHTKRLATYDNAIVRLENALRTVPGSGLVAEPFRWDAKQYGPPPVGETRDRFGNPDGQAALRLLREHSDEHRKALADLDSEPASATGRYRLGAMV